MKTQTAERVHREWWTIHNDDVLKVTGYSCGPNNPGVWWCPSVGESLNETHHLFDTEQIALDRAIELLKRSIQSTVDNLQKLVVRRHNLK